MKIACSFGVLLGRQFSLGKYLNEEELLWKNNIYTSIDMSDISTQKKIWLGQSKEFASSFVETVNTLYDFDFENFVSKCYHTDYDRFNISIKIFNEMKNLNTLIKNYNPIDPCDDETILYDSNWLKIVLQAQNIINIWAC